MPTPVQRFVTAAKELKGIVISGSGAVGAGAGLSVSATSVAGVVSGIVPTAGPVILGAAAVAAPVLVIGGLAVAAGAIAYGTYRVLRPRNRSKYNNKPVTEKDLDDKYWSCHIYRVGVVGVTRSGKTEVKTKIRGMGRGRPNTKHIESHVICIDENDKLFIALIDGQGAQTGSTAQQFQIADQSQILLVLFDHNDSDTDPTISLERQGEHDAFFSQLRARVSDKKDELRVIFLLNKRDLWKKNTKLDIDKLDAWFNKHVKDWRDLGILFSSKTMELTAFENDDMARLKHEIIEAARSLEK